MKIYIGTKLVDLSEIVKIIKKDDLKHQKYVLKIKYRDQIVESIVYDSKNTRDYYFTKIKKNREEWQRKRKMQQEWLNIKNKI